MIADDDDLAALSVDQKRQLVGARLEQLTGRLYEALLNRVGAPDAQAGALDADISALRASIGLHRDELAALDA